LDLHIPKELQIEITELRILKNLAPIL